MTSAVNNVPAKPVVAGFIEAFSSGSKTCQSSIQNCR
jgi:hypothetical protein